MQRYFSNIKENNNLILANDDIYHITKVMRMKDDSKIEVVYNSKLYICSILLDKLPSVSIIKEEESLVKELNVTLVVPLLKEQKFDLILQKSTELGVCEIIPVNMERCLVKQSDREEKKVERWNKICKEAAEQSKRTSIPVVTPVKNLKDLVNMEGLKVVCSTSEKANNIKKFLTVNNKYDKIIIVVGPEGGISNNEEEFLANNGFTRVSLGNRIMRVETVPLFIISILNYENME